LAAKYTAQINENEKSCDAIFTLPVTPPKECNKHNSNILHPECIQCTSISEWQNEANSTVDDIIWRVNRHTCHNGCFSKKYLKCKSRFPREIVPKSSVDSATGHLHMQHGESDLNTFNTTLTYLMRCNSDVTSLLSGTAIKSVIAYVADYITKTPLKTHVMIETINSVFSRNIEYLNGDASQADKARKIMVQIVNSLTVKQEIGAPMAALYLLGNPDHYTNYKYKVFYWQSFVREAQSAWPESETSDSNVEPTVAIYRNDLNKIVSSSFVADFTMRPKKCEKICLYDWVIRASKYKVGKTAKRNISAQIQL
jgi:hypothetical protein